MARPASVELENKNRFWSKWKTDPLSKKGWSKINYKENHFIKRNVLRRHSSLKVVPALGLLRASQALTSGVEGLLCYALPRRFIGKPFYILTLEVRILIPASQFCVC